MRPEARSTTTIGADPSVGPPTEPDIDGALRWLLDRQDPDDGHWEAHSLTALRDTSTAVGALRTLGIRGEVLEVALSWLSLQNPDRSPAPCRGRGTAGRAASLVSERGRGLRHRRARMARLRSPRPGVAAIPAIPGDGSWNTSIYQTAVVLQALAPASLANLSVAPSDIALAPDPPEVDDLVQITVTVHNRSRIPAGPFDVQLFDGDPELGGIPIGAPQPVAGIAAAGEASVGFEWDTAGLEGEHQLLAFADMAGAVSESSIEDNVAVRPVDVLPPLPNLVVESLTIDPASPAEGTPVTVTVRIANRGSVPSAPVRLRFHEEVPELGIKIGEESVPALQVDETFEASAVWETTGKVGSHTLFAVVDPDNDERERLETDNRRSVPVDVRIPPPAEPDLVVTGGDLALVPAELEELPQDLRLTARIRNTGLDDVPAALVELFQGSPENGGLLLDAKSVAFPGDRHVDVTFDFAVTSGGTRTFFVRVDGPGAVVERDEENNLASILFMDRMDIVEVSAVSGSLVLSSLSLTAGETLQVTVGVLNGGTRPLASVPVALFVDDEPPLERFVLASTTSLALEAGESASVTLPWKANRPGTVALEVRVDPENVLTEANESNNVLGASVNVVSSNLPNLTLASADIAASPETLLEGQSATFQVRVRNVGDVDAQGFDVELFGGPPQEGPLVGSVPVASLAAGGEVVLSFDWPSVNVRGATPVYVVLDPAEAIEEVDELDNVVFRVFDIVGLPDLFATTAQIRLTPAFARSGEIVTIEASFTNVGGQDAAPMGVELRLDDINAGPLVDSTEIGNPGRR